MIPTAALFAVRYSLTGKLAYASLSNELQPLPQK